MAFRRTIARSIWAAKSAAASSAAAVPKPPPPILPARRTLPVVEDCPTLAFLRPRPATARYSTVSVPLPHHCFPAFPVGDQLFNRLVDGLTPPPAAVPWRPGEAGVTLQEARKVARAAEMEAARATLRANPESVVSRSEYAALCVDIAGGAEGGRRLAGALDEAGAVIVLADAVFLRPDQVAKAIGSMLPAPARAAAAGDDVEARTRELAALERQKAAIDAKAAAQTRRELWCGLGLLAAQTLGFMRLTFWELSWDVMEPVCFYVTSIYFMSGYTFFMRTAMEPSFEGFYRSRFAARQRRLMRARQFDVARYNALKQGERRGVSGSGSVAQSDHGECDADVFRHATHAHQ
ncbi:calcium uniporter protein 2, mitochondrial-like [Triticum dicoccoides]|uniref:calcium uniporter protein 2, mitochondrial-like n=1 Tax=Triticum dicoccoides TaxID=85692 RepID=UPI0008426939|nr:calcium uniporter protein 2, mitochondrial-like [Triticum dicoccoides]XP_044360216.1 calcium uniporter protein 2, mitochondrial-like [Triticum aestivum]